MGKNLILNFKCMVMVMSLLFACISGWRNAIVKQSDSHLNSSVLRFYYMLVPVVAIDYMYVIIMTYNAVRTLMVTIRST